MMSWPSEQDRRTGLLGMAVCWLLAGAGNLAVQPGPYPSVSIFLGILFLGCGFGVLAFLERPSSWTRFSLTGSLTILTISLQLFYSVFGLFLGPKEATSWLLLVLFVPLFGTFWWFWTRQVRPWHQYHQARVRDTMEDMLAGRRSAWPGSDPQVALKQVKIIRQDGLRAGGRRNGSEAV
jgi:hypothetical protein